MGKTAKKKEKSAAQAATQRRHNRATRGNNTKNRPIEWKQNVLYNPWLQWDWSRTHDALVDPNDGRTVLVKKKPEKQQPLPEPIDLLLSDWEDGLRSYALEKDAEIERTPLIDGRYKYTVWKESFDQLRSERSKEVLLTVESPRNLHFGRRKKFRKKR